MGTVRSLCLVAPVLVGLAGCSFGGGGGGARYACAAADQCPDGLSCVGGFCQGSAFDGGGGGDGDTNQGAACGTVSLLADDFEDGLGSAALPIWNDGAQTTISETGGQLRLHFDAAQDEWAGVRSALLYHIRGGEILAEVDQAGGRYAVLEVRERDGPKAQILVEDGITLQATILNAPSGSEEVNEEYDPVAHRVWRMRERDGDLLFETAPEPASDDWHTVATMPLPFTGDLVEVIVSGAGRSGDADIRFGALNTGVVAPAGYCPASDLVDDFTAAPFDPDWYSWENDGCSAAERESAFEVSFTEPGSAWCGIDSMQLYSLDAGPLVVAVGAPLNGTSSAVVVGVWVTPVGQPEIYVEMARQDGDVLLRVGGPTVSDQDEVPYSDEHRFFRLRAGDGGRVYGDISDDGADWTEQFDLAAPFDLSAVQVSLQGGLVDGASANGDTARILGVNAGDL